YTVPSYQDTEGNRYSRAQVTNEKIRPNGISFQTVSSYSGKDWFQTSNDPLLIELVTETGHSYTPTTYRTINGNTIHGNPKHLAAYETPINVSFEAEHHETKEIRVVEDSVIRVGESKGLKSEV